MLKRICAVRAVVTMAALVGGSINPAVGQAAAAEDDDHGRVLRVSSTNTEEAFVDVGEPDFSLGDSFVFTSNLTKAGKGAGHTGVVCTITST